MSPARSGAAGFPGATNVRHESCVSGVETGYVLRTEAGVTSDR
jgi:hypothetical protein